MCLKEGCSAKFNQSSSLARHLKSHNKVGKVKMSPEKEKPVVPKLPKKMSYGIPEMLADLPISETPVELTPSCIEEPIRTQNICQQEPQQATNQMSYSIPQQSLLPEALNPMNLINSSSTNTYNPHSASSLLLPIPSHHEPSQMPDHQIHHFSNFDNTTYLPPTPNILPNSFNFIMGGLDFSKNSLNGEPTYIDY